MQVKRIIWNILKNNGCYFRRTILKNAHCTNIMNITSQCNLTFCPLINKKYAIVGLHKACLFLYTKLDTNHVNSTSHWKKLKLSTDFKECCEKLDSYLGQWPKFFLFLNKLRIYKIFNKVLSKQNLHKALIASKEVIIKKKVSYDIYFSNFNFRNHINIETLRKAIYKKLKKGVYGNSYFFSQIPYPCSKIKRIKAVIKNTNNYLYKLNHNEIT